MRHRIESLGWPQPLLSNQLTKYWSSRVDCVDARLMNLQISRVFAVKFGTETL